MVRTGPHGGVNSESQMVEQINCNGLERDSEDGPAGLMNALIVLFGHFGAVERAVNETWTHTPYHTAMANVPGSYLFTYLADNISIWSRVCFHL